MVSKRRDAHHSFQNVRQLSANKDAYTKPRMLAFKGLLLCGFVHRNARMTEMERSGIEVDLVFADNGREEMMSKA